MTPDVPAPPIPRHQCRDGYIRRYDRDFPPVDAFPRRPARVEPSPRKSLVEGGARSGHLLSIVLFLRSSSFDASSINLSAFMLKLGRRHIPTRSVLHHREREEISPSKSSSRRRILAVTSPRICIGRGPPSI